MSENSADLLIYSAKRGLYSANFASYSAETAFSYLFLWTAQTSIAVMIVATNHYLDSAGFRQVDWEFRRFINLFRLLC
ncbi:MAG: hypothetical protein ACJ8MO_19400 [Bacillus sp. (in: firmicutes)]